MPPALAARALGSATPEELEQLLAGGPLPRLQQRLTDLTERLRYEEAARLRDRIKALEQLVERLHRLEQLRSLNACLIAPSLTPAGGKPSSSAPVPSAPSALSRRGRVPGWR
jgi:hypothetical protein